LQQRDENDAGGRAEVAAAPAEDRGAAENDRGDRRQEVGVTHRLRRLTCVAGQQHAAERGKTAGVILITLLQSILSVVQMSEAGRQITYGAVIVAMLLLYGRENRVR
jgi:hypothetical protein